MVTIDTISDTLKASKAHFSRVISDVDAFMRVLDECKASLTVTRSSLDDLLHSLKEYKFLLDAQDEIEPSLLLAVGRKLTETLLHIKMQMVLELSSEPSEHCLSKVQEDMLSTHNDTDAHILFEAMVAHMHSGDGVSIHYDDLFVLFEAIIKQQTDYTASLAGISLKKCISNMVESSKGIADAVLGLVRTSEDFTQSIGPILDYVNKKTIDNQTMLEKNVSQMDRLEGELRGVRNKQDEVFATLFQTQRGVNKALDNMGFEQMFNCSLKIVTDYDYVRGRDGLGAANDDTMLAE